MKIIEIKEKKKNYLELLLLADEQEDMIDKYLDRGRIFALYDNELRCICVVTQEGNGIYELKNIATYEKYQRRGYGKKLIEYICELYKPYCSIMHVGTGDCPFIISFYEKCGFSESHRVENFFTDNYDHPIIEDGIQLIDMVYLKREL